MGRCPHARRKGFRVSPDEIVFATITIGRGSISLTGQFVIESEEDIVVDFTKGHVSLKREEKPTDAPAENDPNVSVTKDFYTQIQADGSFRIEEISPGEYGCGAYIIDEEDWQLYGQMGSLANFHGPNTVPPLTDSPSSEVDLGMLVMKVIKKLKPGQVAPPFVVQGLNGGGNKVGRLSR